MEDSRILEAHDLSYSGGEECPQGFEAECDVESQRLFLKLKCSMLKLALDGADKLLMDHRTWNSNIAALECRAGFADVHGEAMRPSLDSTQVFEENDVEERRDGAITAVSATKDCVNVSRMVNSSSTNYDIFPLNILAFIMVLLIKAIEMQVSLLVKFFTFPIWLSNFSLMLLLSPFQTLGHIRGYLMTMVLRMWSATFTNVTSAACGGLKTQKSLAVKIGFALFRSIYMFSMLLGILASGFLLSAFMMKHLVEKPIKTIETLNFDYTKSSPVALVPLMSSGVGGIPYGHKLQMTVSLTVPDSQYNHILGVFQTSLECCIADCQSGLLSRFTVRQYNMLDMDKKILPQKLEILCLPICFCFKVRVEFLSAKGDVTTSLSHPCMLQYESLPIHYIRTFLRSAPLIAGLQSETQVLNIKIKEHIERLEPTACLKVILEQRAEFHHGGGIPQIYAGSLLLQSVLPQLKKFVWYWRKTIFVWTSIASFLAELVFILVFFRPMLVPRRRPETSTRNTRSSNIFRHKSRLGR